MTINSEVITKALGQPVPSQEFADIVTDSRKVAPGDLFVAIKGETYDGHDFIPQALRQGAAGVLSHKQADTSSIVQVPDTIAAFRAIAKEIRAQANIPVAAIAGSVGKTTTKELVAHFLRDTPLLKTESSQNGYLGIAMTLARLRPAHKLALVEIGIDTPGAMAEHVAIVKPTLSLVTEICEEHLLTLGDLATVIKEETTLLRMTDLAGGCCLLNIDCEPIAQLAGELSGKDHITYGLGSSTGRYPHVQGELKGKSLHVKGALFSSPQAFVCPLEGEHNAKNLLAALVCAKALGASDEILTMRCKDFKPLAGRSQVLAMKGNIRVFADYYNAQPLAMKEAMRTVCSLKPKGRVFMCLGDMAELGADEMAIHRSLAGPIVSLAPEGVFLMGEKMRTTLLPALQERQFGGILAFFASEDDLAVRLDAVLEEGDIVLIKGSRGMAMERVISALRKVGRDLSSGNSPH